MEVKIDDTLALLLEITYINGLINGKTIPEMSNLNKLMKDLLDNIKTI